MDRGWSETGLVFGDTFPGLCAALRDLSGIDSGHLPYYRCDVRTFRSLGKSQKEIFVLTPAKFLKERFFDFPRREEVRSPEAGPLQGRPSLKTSFLELSYRLSYRRRQEFMGT